MNFNEIDVTPGGIFNEYKDGNNFKAGIGDKGLFEQAQINERFYIGDQWHGVKCGSDKPLVRRNVIRRIGDYKLAVISAAPLSVNFSAEGIPDSAVTDEIRKEAYSSMISGKDITDKEKTATDQEISLMMNFLTDYGATVIERLNFNKLAAESLKRAYITGTGILYTYWDDMYETGLFADNARTEPVKGDIACQVLDVENVMFGDPNNPDVQSQPYIIIAQRRNVKEVQREAKISGRPDKEIQQIIPTGASTFNNQTDGGSEPVDSQRVTVLTKFYKEYDEDLKSFKVKCIRVTEKAVVRDPWDIKIKKYPIAKVVWEEKRNNAYGDSDITFTIPNQIAINRELSAKTWSMLCEGMPIMVVNGDIVTEDVTNDPGQIIKIYGTNEDVAGAIRYVQPPQFAGQLIASINDLAQNTLADNGANEAALGDINPDNAQAILQVQEASLRPLQMKQNRYYTFVEDVMRIWAEFWLNFYGDRKLKIKTRDGTSYIQFHANRYKNLLVNAKIDVGASTIYSVTAAVATLGNFLERGYIDLLQYLERVPNGYILDKQGLIDDLKKKQQAMSEEQEALSDDSILNEWSNQNPEMYQKFLSQPIEEQQRILAGMRAGQEDTQNESGIRS